MQYMTIDFVQLVQYTPLVEVNQKMFAWSFRQFGILTHTQNCLDMFEVRQNCDSGADKIPIIIEVGVWGCGG